MKQWLLDFSAHLAALAVWAGVIYALVYFLWWIQPLDEPMHLAAGSAQLQPDYTLFWGVLIAVAGLAVCGLLAWIGVSLARLSKQQGV